MTLDNTQDGLIFVWGNFGKKLEKKDKKRLFAIAQKNPDYFLSVMYDLELDNLIDEISENGLSDDIKLQIIEMNDNHNLFKEISEFFLMTNDNLSIGSLLTGNIDKSGRFASILKNEEGD